MTEMLYADALDRERDKLGVLSDLRKEVGNFQKSLNGAVSTGLFSAEDLKWPLGNVSDLIDDLEGMMTKQQDSVDQMELRFQSKPRQRFESAAE